jgi:hypothetical protein
MLAAWVAIAVGSLALGELVYVVVRRVFGH